MHKKKHSIYRVWYYPWFQAHAVGLEMHPLWIRRGNCTFCPQSRYNRAEIQMLGRTRQEMKKGEIGLVGILGKWRAPSLGRQRLLHRSKSTENKPSMARPASKTKLWNLKSLTEKKKKTFRFSVYLQAGLSLWIVSLQIEVIEVMVLGGAITHTCRYLKYNRERLCPNRGILGKCYGNSG